MSINNVYIIKQNPKDGRWYGWNEPADKVTGDTNGKRVLRYRFADISAPTEEKLRYHMEDSYYMAAEYGFATKTLPKDGTPIEFL